MSFNKFIAQIKLVGNFQSQCFHSKFLRLIMPAGKEVELEFLGEVEMMLFELASYQGIGTGLENLVYRTLTGAGENGDFFRFPHPELH